MTLVSWSILFLNTEMTDQDSSVADLNRETISLFRTMTILFRETIKVSWEIVSQDT